MKLGQRCRVLAQARDVALEVGTHRRPVHALEDEIGTVMAEDLWGGEAVRPHVLDDRDFLLGDVPPPVAPKHPVLVKRVHVGVPSPSEDGTRFDSA